MTSPLLQFSPMEQLRAEQARLAELRKQAVIDKDEDRVNNIDSALCDIVNKMERVGDASFLGPRCFGLPSVGPSDQALRIAIAPPHNATMCDRWGHHVFYYAGGALPEGWPCDCGQTLFTRE